MIALAVAGAGAIYLAAHVDGMTADDAAGFLRQGLLSLPKLTAIAVLMVMGLRMAAGHRPSPFRLPMRWSAAIAATGPGRAIAALVRHVNGQDR